MPPGGRGPDERARAWASLARGVRATLADNVVFVEQRDGDVVCIPPGVAHSVVSLQARVKYAGDGLSPHLFADVLTADPEHPSAHPLDLSQCYPTPAARARAPR